MYTISSEWQLLNKTILISKNFGGGIVMGQDEFIRNMCPVDRCILTHDTNEASTADAILITDSLNLLNATHPRNQVKFVNTRPLHMPPLKKYQLYSIITFQIWIYYYLESRCTHSLPPFASKIIAWTASYNRDSEIVTPYGRWVYHNPKITEKEPDRNYAANKTKKVNKHDRHRSRTVKNSSRVP